jgi:two-component system, chemotaxis family, protein-glutamate methylesterase/glutaminase
MTARGSKIRVLVVDDSALVQKVLTAELSKCPDIEVVGAASDPYIARDKILQLSPDVITLDIEMPRMDGLTFLRKLMAHRPTPVVIVSSLAPANGEVAMRALALGAVEVVPKPGSQFSVPEVEGQLATAIRAASVARLGASKSENPRAVAKATQAATPLRTTDKVVAIGASTGGTRAVEAVLAALPPTVPGIVIVQHMPAGFTGPFAERLDRVCAMNVREARDGDPVAPGVALIAPAGKHTLVVRSGGHYAVRIKDGPPVQFQRPSVDVLFHAVAKSAGPNAVGVLLTGMGQDGAHGLAAMREAGAPTMAESESTAVVFGMPKAAIDIGAASEVVALHDVAHAILRRVGSASRAAS